MDERIGTTYLGQRGGWDRIGVKIGGATYFILTRPARDFNHEVIGYRARIMSGRTYPAVDTAADAAIGAIERIPPGSF